MKEKIIDLCNNIKLDADRTIKKLNKFNFTLYDLRLLLDLKKAIEKKEKYFIFLSEPLKNLLVSLNTKILMDENKINYILNIEAI